MALVYRVSKFSINSKSEALTLHANQNIHQIKFCWSFSKCVNREACFRIALKVVLEVDQNVILISAFLLMLQKQKLSEKMSVMVCLGPSLQCYRKNRSIPGDFVLVLAGTI